MRVWAGVPRCLCVVLKLLSRAGTWFRCLDAPLVRLSAPDPLSGGSRLGCFNYGTCGGVSTSRGRISSARVHSIPPSGRRQIGSVIGLWRCQPERLGRQRGAGRVHSIPLPPGWPTPEGADRRRVSRCGASSGSRCTAPRRLAWSRRPYPSATRQSRRRSGSLGQPNRARVGGRTSCVVRRCLAVRRR